MKTGLYDQDKTSKGPKGQMLLLGFKFDKASDKNPDKIVKQLRTAAKANKLTITNVDTGDAGGKAVCLASPSDAAIKVLISLALLPRAAEVPAAPKREITGTRRVASSRRVRWRDNSSR